MKTLRVKQEIWKTVQELNGAWTVENDPKKLSTYFHKNMVAVAPNSPKRISGGKKCALAWMAFARSCEIQGWKEIDPEIQIYGGGKFAIVTYYYEMSVETNGKILQLSGRDMLSLVKENRRWKCVADQFSPYPK